jgi:hypothetical protein
MKWRFIVKLKRLEEKSQKEIMNEADSLLRRSPTPNQLKKHEDLNTELKETNETLRRENADLLFKKKVILEFLSIIIHRHIKTK